MTTAPKRARFCLYDAVHLVCDHTAIAIRHLLVHVWATVTIKLQNPEDPIKSAMVFSTCVASGEQFNKECFPDLGVRAKLNPNKFHVALSRKFFRKLFS